MRGDTRAAHRDVDAADHALGSGICTEETFFAHWLESPHLAAYRGNLLQLLGRAEEAIDVIEDSLASLSPSLTFCRCSELVDLAAAYIQNKDIEHACGLLQEALDLCSERSLVAPAQRVVALHHHLTGVDDIPAVHQLDEQIHELAWAST
jgi:tetratricopeptide (TPR) repeat protein